MIVEIADLLQPEELLAVQSVLHQGQFVDGKLSAGRDASSQKTNLELAPDESTYRALNDVVMTRLVQHPTYLQAALPAKICPPLYARYETGMGYGDHIDDPLIGPPMQRLRSDLSITVFLNAPEDYDGGELCIETDAGEREFKLDAGQALIYPSNRLHRVNPVSKGVRLVAITWVQSHIRSSEQRDILLRLDRARTRLAAAGDPARSELDLAYANLFRLWAET